MSNPEFNLNKSVRLPQKAVSQLGGNIAELAAYTHVKAATNSKRSIALKGRVKGLVLQNPPRNPVTALTIFSATVEACGIDIKKLPTRLSKFFPTT